MKEFVGYRASPDLDVTKWRLIDRCHLKWLWIDRRTQDILHRWHHSKSICIDVTFPQLWCNIRCSSFIFCPDHLDCAFVMTELAVNMNLELSSFNAHIASWHSTPVYKLFCLVPMHPSNPDTHLRRHYFLRPYIPLWHWGDWAAAGGGGGGGGWWRWISSSLSECCFFCNSRFLLCHKKTGCLQKNRLRLSPWQNSPCGKYRVRGQPPPTGGREHTHTWGHICHDNLSNRE